MTVDGNGARRGVGNPVTIFKAVDFPAPLWPKNATASPLLILNDR